MEGVKQYELYSLLHFIYHGEVTVTEESIYDFMKVAKQFKLADFAKECSDKDDDDVRNNLEELSRCEQIVPDDLINNSMVDNLNFDKKPCISYSKDKEEITMNLKELYRNHEESSLTLVENTSINVENSVRKCLKPKMNIESLERFKMKELI